MRKLAILIDFACAAFGQRHKLEEVDAEKPEGKLLQQILQGKRRREEGRAHGTVRHGISRSWMRRRGVLEQLVGTYVKAGNHDKILATGPKAAGRRPRRPLRPRCNA